MNGEYAAGDFFSVLGVKPARGRLIGPNDDRLGAGGPAAAVVSWSYWKSRFNLDPAIVGKRMVVQDLPVTVVGVAPPAFFGLQVGSRTDIWLPRAAAAGRLGFNLLGRLKPASPWRRRARRWRCCTVSPSRKKPAPAKIRWSGN